MKDILCLLYSLTSIKRLIPLLNFFTEITCLGYQRNLSQLDKKSNLSSREKSVALNNTHSTKNTLAVVSTGVDYY